MKQVTILCSGDLSDRVRDVLARSGAEGFLDVTGAAGFKPAAAAEHGRWPRWEAQMFLAAVDEATLDKIVGELRGYAGQCEIAPCLRILVSPLDAVY